MPKKKHAKQKSSRTYRRQRFNFFKFFFWIVLLLLAGAVIYGGYKFLFDKSYDLPDVPTPSAVEYRPTADTQMSTQDTAKGDKPTETEEAEESDGKTPVQYDGDNANTSESLTGVITYAAMSGDKLIVRTNIDQYLGSGTCTLTVSDDSHSLTRTAAIIPEASTSTCEGFDIPSSELADFSGQLILTITLESANRTGSLTAEVK